jgi:hypothetical protein
VKVEVGFEALNENVVEGIQMLHECAKSNAKIFISKLSGDASKIEKLESLLDHISNK